MLVLIIIHIKSGKKSILLWAVFLSTHCARFCILKHVQNVQMLCFKVYKSYFFPRQDRSNVWCLVTRQTSRGENPVRVCTRDIYMFLWDYAAIEKKKKSGLGDGPFRHKWVKIWFVPKTRSQANPIKPRHPRRPSSLFRLGNKLTFGGTTPCYTSQLKICIPPNKITEKKNPKMLEWEERCFWFDRPGSFTEGSVQTFSVTRKVIYSDTKLSACCVRELDDQYPMRKNKYGDAKQRWEGRRVAKVNWLTPFLAERHLSSTLRPFGVAIVFQLCTRRETKSHGRPTFFYEAEASRRPSALGFGRLISLTIH